MRNSGKMWLVLIVLVALICSTVYSQNAKTFIQGKDTFCIIPIRMVREINDSKLAQMECDSLHKIGKAMLQDKLNEICVWTDIVQNQDKIIANDSIIQQILQDDNQKLVNTVNDNKKQVKKLKVQRNVLGIFSGIFALAAGVFAYFTFR